MRKLSVSNGRTYTEDGWWVQHRVVKKARKLEDGGYDVTTEDNWDYFGNGFFIPAERVKGVLNPGDSITLYDDRNFIRGYAVNGVEWHYLNKVEAEQERLNWLANYEKEKEENYQKNHASYVERTKKLMPVLRDRIAFFEKTHGFKEFWKESGGYELAILEGVQALHTKAEEVYAQDGFTTPKEWVEAFKSVEYQKQVSLIPVLDEMGLSGFQFSAVIGITKALFDGIKV